MKFARQTLLAATLLLLPSLCIAATQGELGSESTAVNRITLIIHPSVQITNVDDITIYVNERNRDALHTEEVCVRGNSEASYSVLAHTGGVGESEFLLRNEEQEDLEFEVRYRSDLSAASGEVLRPNIQSQLQLSGLTTGEENATCAGGNFAAFDLKFSANKLSTANPGVYTGSLTLTVVAE